MNGKQNDKRTDKMELAEENFEKVYQLGMSYHKSCTGCAQCAVAALLEVLDMENDDVFKAASGLSGGIGLSTNGSCGALTGGALVIGLLFGRDIDDFLSPMAAMTSYDLVKELRDYFMAEFGSCCCADIQKKLVGRSFNLRDPEDAAAFVTHEMHDHCARVVGKGTRKTLEIITEHWKRQ
ncbi:MAG TPA: C-GCAxxG-C-C family protein [Smithellaceae bacterium]|nr:C-GCAxxG-C-C family protein [Smithellaceae bacterium]